MQIHRPLAVSLIFLMASVCASAQRGGRGGRGPGAANAADAPILILKPARVFDGESTHEGWAVRVRGQRIDAAGPLANIDTAGARVLDLSGLTLLPGLVEGHSHILLHPYNETAWADQVAHESEGLRVARATNHLRN